MLTIKKILCSTDFSEPSYKGLEYAKELAALFKAELAVVYVLPLLPYQPTDPNVSYRIPEYERMIHKDSEQQLQELIKQRFPENLNVRAIIGHGNEAKEIVRIAEEEKSDLIVIATHGVSGWHHFIVGSVAEKVIRTAPCPVFAVREHRK
jgi:nucleotide-binding universal stress UspA family protein